MLHYVWFFFIGHTLWPAGHIFKTLTALANFIYILDKFNRFSILDPYFTVSEEISRRSLNMNIVCSCSFIDVNSDAMFDVQLIKADEIANQGNIAEVLAYCRYSLLNCDNQATWQEVLLWLWSLSLGFRSRSRRFLINRASFPLSPQRCTYYVYYVY